MKPNAHLWAIVLAGGDGRRVAGLTRTGDGTLAPKQFCALDGRRSLLGRTIDRATALVPRARVVTVVAARHRRWWEGELATLPRKNVMVQPHNRGTAAGILLPLLEILGRDPRATVVILPSDHHVAREDLLRASIDEAVRATHTDAGHVLLLGMTPVACDTEYGWILPAAANETVAGVSAFVEKPNRSRARFLMRRGALLNSLILVAQAAALLRLFERSTPHLLHQFGALREGVAAGSAALETIYRRLSSCDFSRKVLERSCGYLSVVRTPECGWTDVGTPDRVALVRRGQASMFRTTASRSFVPESAGR